MTNASVRSRKTRRAGDSFRRSAHDKALAERYSGLTSERVYMPTRMLAESSRCFTERLRILS
jgi:hypothetical protein